jgi:ABC-type multidrug transport system fused ATPase/permease subunit
MSAVDGSAPAASATAEQQLSPESTRERLRALLGQRKRTVVALALCSVASGLTEAGIIALVAQIAATAFKGSASFHNKVGLFHINASVETMFIVAFGLTALRFALQAPLAMLPAKIASSVQGQLRRELFSAFSRASWEVQAREREGHLQETMTSQVMQATQGAVQATSLITSFFAFMVLMGTAVALNAVAALAVLGSAIILFVLLRPLNVVGARRAKALSRAQLEYAGGISEMSRLAEENQVFGAAAAQRSRIGVLIRTAEQLVYKNGTVLRLAPALYQSAIYLILVGGLAALYASGTAKFASLGAVILLIMRAGTYGQGVQGSYQSLRQSLPFIERLQDTARRYRDSIPSDGGESLKRMQTIAFREVSFSYRPGRPVLSDVSFEVDAGEAIGIIGPSGAGKSTMIQLLLQLRRPERGQYLINGMPVQQFARADWHRLVSYVPQEPRLIHASVADNIRYYRELDDDAVRRAAALARIHEDIVSWPDGYDTVVGPRADAVSGGQQQRICLARALAARPEVLVLDEPTSALDPHSETLIQESLTGLRSELTLFVIAHRMSTLDVCDRVMVIVGGRLVAFDTIATLQRDNDYYRSASTLAVGAAGGSLP